MKQLVLSVHARSPLAIRSDHAPDGSSTAKYIPGTTLIGCLAAAHRMLRSEQTDEFATFFLKEQTSFPVLYPASFGERSFDASNLPVMPLPKTAQSCKRFSGFKPLQGEEVKEERHGVRDSLLDWAIFSLLKDEQVAIPTLLAPLEQHENCTFANCKQPLDHISGYYRRDRSNPHLRMHAESRTHLQTRTGINREWGVVEEGILYNREVLDENMRFWGKALLRDELYEPFQKFIDQAEKEGICRIGTGRTRGLGCVTIKAIDSTRPGQDKFELRLQKFDAAIKEQAGKANVDKRNAFYFAVTLYTPTILCDEFLRYSKTLDAGTLMGLLQHPTARLRNIYQSTGVERITGWNELWGTPRSNDYALQMGSTFLFSCSEPLDATLLEALYNLEETGLGRRTAEGFGRICISDPFHLEGVQA